MANFNIEGKWEVMDFRSDVDKKKGNDISRNVLPLLGDEVMYDCERCRG